MAINYPNNPQLNETYTVSGITWTWDGVAWSILSTSGGGGQVGGGITTISGDTGTITDQTSIAIQGGTDISTSADGSTLTINYTGSGGGGGGGASSLNDLTDVDTSSSPPSEGNVLKYSGGQWVPGTDETGAGGGGGASTFVELTDVPSGLTVAQIYEPAIAMLRVGNTGTSAYTFAPHYSGDNPTLYAISGTTIAFDLTQIGGHPFEIQDSTGTQYNTGLVHVDDTGTVSTGVDAQGKESGVLYWRIPIDATSPPNFRYQCSSHVAMVGPITVKNLAII